MKVVEENFRQLLQKVLCLWRKQIFVYIDEDFAINWIHPKFLSLLMTGIIRIGVTERGSFKKIFGSSAYPALQRLLPLTNSEFTVHMQNQLIAPLSVIPMFYIKYLTMHKVHMHAGAIRQLLYGCAYVRGIIHSLKLVDHPPVHTHKPYNNLHLKQAHV